MLVQLATLNFLSKEERLYKSQTVAGGEVTDVIFGKM